MTPTTHTSRLPSPIRSGPRPRPLHLPIPTPVVSAEGNLRKPAPRTTCSRSHKPPADAPYWQGFGNPVSFAPFLDDLQKRLANQYELGLLVSPKNKASLQLLKLKVTAPGAKIDAPQMIAVPGSESASR